MRMHACSFTEAHLQRYGANLAALRESDPQLVRQLEGLECPATVEPTTGRDGSDTFRIRGDDGAWHWFGRSSMPRVSASAMVGGFSSKGGSVILPGMGTTREILLLERRSPPHCAVLVYEDDPLTIKLGLHLQDFSTMIRRGRLILLWGQALVEALVEVFARRPGLEFPQGLVPLPGQSPARREETRMRLEAAAQRVAVLRAEAAARLAQELGRRSGFAPGGSPRVAVLSRDPRPESVELAKGLAATLNRMGWPAEAGVPDRPDECHTLARLQVVHRHEPDLLLLVNCAKGPLSAYLPKGLPVCSWLVTTDSAEATVGSGLDDHTAFFAARPAIVERLTAAGVDADHLHLLERATDPTVYGPIELDPDGQQRLGCQVAVLADGCDLHALAAGITLSTHVRLWEALCKRTAAVIDKWRDELAEQVLARAERDSHTRLDDSNLQDRFGALIRLRLAPTLTARATIERLADQGLDVVVWGSGWETHASVSSLARGSAGDAVARNALYAAADVVVCPGLDERALQTVLDCLAAGGCPVFLAPQGRLDILHPQLHGVLNDLPSATSPRRLARLAEELSGDRDSRRSATSGARREVLERHTLAARLHTIGEVMARG